MDLYFKIAAIVILLLLSGFFSSTETAFFSLSKVKLRSRKFRKASSVKYILQLLQTPATFLATVLIGNEIVNISLSVVAAALVFSLTRDYFSSAVLPFLSMVLTVPVLLLFGEIIPKTLAARFPEQIAKLHAYPIFLFARAVKPLKYVLYAAAKVFISLFVKDPSTRSVDSVDIDEDIFKSMVDMGSREGTIEPDERVLIHRAFRLDDIVISSIMTPRRNIVAVPDGCSEKEFASIIKEEKYSRYPVFKGSLDHIVGFVHAKDLLRLRALKRPHKLQSIRSIVRKPKFVLETRNALSVFLELQKNKKHMGIVVDKQDQTVGVVTLEDILEELFGDIKDETDIEEDADA